MSIEDSINNSVDLEKRSPNSTKLFTKLSIIASIISLLLFFIGVIAYQVDELCGLNIFAAIYMPMLILFTFSFYLAICERLRAKYMGARLAIIISVLSLMATLTFMAFELIKYGKIFIAPFTPAPVL